MDRRILRAIVGRLTVSIPVAGRALGDLCENTAYAEAKRTGQIGGCPVIDVAAAQGASRPRLFGASSVWRTKIYGEACK